MAEILGMVSQVIIAIAALVAAWRTGRIKATMCEFKKELAANPFLSAEETYKRLNGNVTVVTRTERLDDFDRENHK